MLHGTALDREMRSARIELRGMRQAARQRQGTGMAVPEPGGAIPVIPAKRRIEKP